MKRITKGEQKLAESVVNELHCWVNELWYSINSATRDDRGIHPDDLREPVRMLHLLKKCLAENYHIELPKKGE